MTAASGPTIGGRFQSKSDAGIGVFGWATSHQGATYGILGQTSSSDPTSSALYANGDLGASGTKAFRIDHPLDPENKYLLHYCTESPTPQNFYVGNTVTDEKGYAWVQLPDYFAEINTNFKYQLTVIDDEDADGFVMAKISKEIVGNSFQLRTSLPRVKVSWRVDADRNDLWVQKRQPKDVVEKAGAEKGRFQHPELYNQPDERGTFYEISKRGARASAPADRD